MSEFFQEGPRLGNPYRGDPLLGRLLARLLPRELVAEIEPGLVALGERAASEMPPLAAAAERQPPRHLPFDPWGRRVDAIELSPAWRRLHEIAAEEGIVATAYERRHGALSRLHQFARLYLYHPSSAIYSCPLAMTDGAARALERYADEALRAHALPHLTSRDPQQFWTSGQWMTEKSGGSDVSGTETEARRDGERFRLFGVKWFTSATTAEMALALARIEGAPAGSAGLSMFYLELRDAAGALDGIEILRLKEKLGTRALPTAELRLAGVPARLVGEPGRGVATIATMLNITRLYNACCASGYLARGLALARDYARRRRAFGRQLAEQPLHLETLATVAVEHAGALALTFRAAELLGREECGEASEAERAVLRLLTPLVKLLTGKQAVAGVSELLECFGGAGYLEDTGLPALLRDAQVLPIWEGTTNVLALDLLRALERDEALPSLLDDLDRQLAPARGGDLAEAAHRVWASAGTLQAWVRHAREDGERLEAGARGFALGLARAYAGALLLAQASWERTTSGAAPTASAARRWARRHLGEAPVAADDPRDAAELVFPAGARA